MTPARITVIPNGLDPEIFHVLTSAKRDAKREALDIPVGGTVLWFVGRFVEKKGLAILKELAHDFADCVWIFAGEGPIVPAAWALANVRVALANTRVTLANVRVLPANVRVALDGSAFFSLRRLAFSKMSFDPLKVSSCFGSDY